MERGDIWHVDLNPVKGREQAAKRFVLILTPQGFNRLGTPLVAPITTGGDFARFQGFAVSLTGAGTRTTGVVLCHQIRALDMQARQGRFVERVPDFITDEVLARLATLID